MSINITTISGKLGRDAQVRQLDSGKKVMNFSVAVSEQSVSNGERTESTLWFSISKFFKADQSTKISDYLKKGTAVIIVGKIKEPRIYEGKAQLELIADRIDVMWTNKTNAGQNVEENKQSENNEDIIPF